MLREYNSLLIISKLYIALGHLIIRKKLPGLIVVADHVKQVNFPFYFHSQFFYANNQRFLLTLFFPSEGHSLLNGTRNWFSGISILHAWLCSRRRRNISGIFDHRTQIFGSASQTRGKSDQNVEFAKVLWLWNPLLILHERFRDFVLAGNQNMQFLALWY